MVGTHGRGSCLPPHSQEPNKMKDSRCPKLRIFSGTMMTQPYLLFAWHSWWMFIPKICLRLWLEKMLGLGTVELLPILPLFPSRSWYFRPIEVNTLKNKWPKWLLLQMLKTYEQSDPVVWCYWCILKVKGSKPYSYLSFISLLISMVMFWS